MKSFEAWMRDVDAFAQSKYFVSVHDLPDCCFHDWYDDGMRPATAARLAVRAAYGDDA